MSDTSPSRYDMLQLRNQAIKAIAAQREEIIRAFMAKYYCDPEDVEQVIILEGNTIRWYVRWRKS